MSRDIPRILKVHAIRAPFESSLVAESAGAVGVGVGVGVVVEVGDGKIGSEVFKVSLVRKLVEGLISLETFTVSTYMVVIVVAVLRSGMVIVVVRDVDFEGVSLKIIFTILRGCDDLVATTVLELKILSLSNKQLGALGIVK